MNNTRIASWLDQSRQWTRRAGCELRQLGCVLYQHLGYFAIYGALCLKLTWHRRQFAAVRLQLSHHLLKMQLGDQRTREQIQTLSNQLPPPPWGVPLFNVRYPLGLSTEADKRLYAQRRELQLQLADDMLESESPLIGSEQEHFLALSEKAACHNIQRQFDAARQLLWPRTIGDRLRLVSGFTAILVLLLILL